MSMQEQFADRLAELVEGDQESLLSSLKEMARNTAIDARQNFERGLLRLAQEITEPDKRNAVYEVLVALQSIWNEHHPEKRLQEKFRAAFSANNYKEAEENYKKLAKQGLDYIGTFKTEGGTLIPFVTKEKDFLMEFNKKKLVFYTIHFERLAEIQIPESMDIIEILAPVSHQLSEDMETPLVEEQIDRLWILFRNSEGMQAITSISINAMAIYSLREGLKSLTEHAEYLNENFPTFQRLSYFQNHLILISKKSIYFQENNNWKEWYSNESINNEITAVESTRSTFWVGHSNGNVIILRDLQYVGRRRSFEGFTNSIKKILGKGRFVLIANNTSLRIADYTGIPTAEPFVPLSAIRQCTFLNDSLTLVLLANGLLIAYDFKQGNIHWKINVGNFVRMLFPFRQYIYCVKEGSETIVLETPTFQTMRIELESKSIHVEDLSYNKQPHLNAPIKFISTFIGRRKLLNEIKETPNAHFLIHGAARIGKTSILNVLRDILSETAKCCILDMEQLLKSAHSYETFEHEFKTICMEQHFMKTSDLNKEEDKGYRALRLMVEKIIGNKSFCVFGFDNFYIPRGFNQADMNKFETLLKDMFYHKKIRVISTCNSLEKNEMEKYFWSIKGAHAKQKLLSRSLSLMTELKVKNALRKKISLKQQVVDEIYKYTGRFPHLIHLYDGWESDSQTIEEKSKEIAESLSDKIFEYFRDLNVDAKLLIATFLHENIMAEKISFQTFYDKFPFLRSSLPKDQLEKVLEEISHYGDGLLIKKDEEAFEITINGNAQLFPEAAKHISWIKNFRIIYQFTSSPDQKKAQLLAQTFTQITQSELELDEKLREISNRYQDKFFVSKLADRGLDALKMSLPTFVLIPSSQWRQDTYMEPFFDLYSDLQEFNRKSGGQLFYILLLDPHGSMEEEVKSTLEGFDRIPIIDAPKLKNIIMAKTPKEKTTEYIFSQLGIRERSPYTTSGAVPDSLFFGRQMELALIRGLPENIGIFGTRTIGKTSLLRRLRNAFKTQKQWRVYDMDCSQINNEESLLTNLAEKMDVPFEEIADMGKFRKYITREAEAGNHRYLFLLDEVDRLVYYDTRHGEKIFNTFNRLCNEAMSKNETAARFILFGFQEMFEQMKNPVSRLYNFMVFMPLKPLDRDGAMRLVTQPIENILVNWENKEDAEYLVDKCSRHPRLLQAACHALLSRLDAKENKRDIIERIDVDYALRSDEFREICMRFYQDRDDERINKEKKRAAEKDEPEVTEKSRHILGIRWGSVHKEENEKKRNVDESLEEPPPRNNEKEFLSDLHRITILTAIRLVFEEYQEVFAMADIHAELKSFGIDVTPNIMRNIFDRLCLSGNFRLRDETIVLTKEDRNVKRKADEIDPSINKENKSSVISVTRPENYIGTQTTFPKFTFEFGVKIFPELLVAHFGGLEKCEEERNKLIERGHWREWLRRY